ncbi:c-type cytochrome [Pelagicoccus sp. SDUM812005]|uniref:c-type cytochrome n=1 Tax=Pelagicoccus sp. SDUM812005 TaxID=3041257 RepID=UPI00280E5B9A|nr:c-type cytochrome [Pelagicoccus sp. SDUM812005]MDQ8179033.1 c-type cytochrome [Pelagicoccus sp. SDUM812005]
MKSIISSLSKTAFRLAMVGFLASLGSAVSHANDERGKQLYANCVACHQADGSGLKLLNAPAIAGLSEKYVAAQIAKFKAGHRGGDPRDTSGLQMRPMASLLASEADIAAVSKYVASLEPKPIAATLEGGNAERGKALYATCQACHGADGAGNDLLNAPSLLNQHDWYHVAQLQKFKDGVRGSNPQDTTGAQMRPMAMMLTDEQAVKDVVAYIQTLSN